MCIRDSINAEYGEQRTTMGNNSSGASAELQAKAARDEAIAKVLKRWPVSGAPSTGPPKPEHSGQWVFYSHSEDHWSHDSPYQPADSVHPSFGQKWTSDKDRMPAELEKRDMTPHWSCCGQVDHGAQCTEECPGGG
eukprot:TRINITY_DN53388_c0_g1_i1.p1 TRINITY_DN53388_c0_g1~~TRINITY_DN53388_c0_g1_i1.p1  ORF type:complete len:144 (-),score=19.30 TRINITY_DN53388_c0_g1_i1:242-649(-)